MERVLLRYKKAYVKLLGYSKPFAKAYFANRVPPGFVRKSTLRNWYP